MLIVFPFCAKDWLSAKRNIEWMAELDGRQDFQVVLSHDDQTKAEWVEQVRGAAQAAFARVDTFWYPAPVKNTWPYGANIAWQEYARYHAAVHPKESWLWIEADCVPIRKGWLKDIVDGYAKCGAPFFGHKVNQMNHMNGCGCYPGIVAAYSMAAMRAGEAAWDAVMGPDIQQHLVHSDLFQHVWTIGPDGEPWNGAGELATFKDTHDVVRLVNLESALFHRCKDGTLITQLREHYKHPEVAFVPSHVERVEIKAEPAPLIEKDYRFTGQCEILMVTYYRDEPWTQWSLRLIRRWTSRFAGITLVIPKRDAAKFAWVGTKDWGVPMNVKLFEEAHGKGMLHHMIMMAGADKLVPHGTTHVLHVDADCMFKEEASPDDYIIEDRPIYVVRTYESLYDKERKVISDCAQWKGPTEKQLGFPVEMYTMCRHPTCFPIDFYEKYRTHIECVQGKDFVTYMLSGRNNHPQTRMDFTAMGAFAYEKMRERFIWVDAKEAPRDKMKPFWSHGGITDEIKTELDRFIR